MQHFTLNPAGAKVVGLWVFLPGLVAAPFLFWQGFLPGAVFLCVWLVFALLVVPARLGSTQGSLSLGEMRLSQGILFKRRQRIPTRFVTGTSRLETPLLRACRCCVLLVYTSGTVLILPGIGADAADQLVRALQGGPVE